MNAVRLWWRMILGFDLPTKGSLAEMLEKLTNARVRQYFYALATAMLAFAVGYNWIAPDKLPLWLGVFAALFAISATATATVAVAKQRGDGTFSSRRSDTPEVGRHAAFDGGITE